MYQKRTARLLPLMALLGCSATAHATRKPLFIYRNAEKTRAYSDVYLDGLKGRWLTHHTPSRRKKKVKVTGWEFDRDFGVLLRTKNGRIQSIDHFEPDLTRHPPHLVENKTPMGKMINDWMFELKELWSTPFMVGEYDSMKRAAAKIYPHVASAISDPMELSRSKLRLKETYRNIILGNNVAAADEDFAQALIITANGGAWTHDQHQLDEAVAQLVPHARLYRKKIFDLAVPAKTVKAEYDRLWNQVLDLLDPSDRRNALESGL